MNYGPAVFRAVIGEMQRSADIGTETLATAAGIHPSGLYRFLGGQTSAISFAAFAGLAKAAGWDKRGLAYEVDRQAALFEHNPLLRESGEQGWRSPRLAPTRKAA